MKGLADGGGADRRYGVARPDFFFGFLRYWLLVLRLPLAAEPDRLRE
jgi:hypothetical protein